MRSVKRQYFAGHTDTGLVRTSNQDTYYVDPDGQFFIVADGMGGHKGGEEASYLAVEAVKTYCLARWGDTVPTDQLLKLALEEANQKILEDQHQHPDRSDMGTTVVVLGFRDNKFWSAHVGDSRLYRLRSGVLEQITHDHTWIAQALETKTISPDQARTHPWRHVLTQCLGREDLERIDIESLYLQPGDRLLLCSDGLTEELADDHIAEYLGAGQANSSETCKRRAIALIDGALTKGGRDNITVIVVAIPDY